MATPSQSDDVQQFISITVTHAGKAYKFTFKEHDTLAELVIRCRDELLDKFSYDWARAKFLSIKGVKRAGNDNDFLLSELNGSKMQLFVQKLSDIEYLRAAEAVGKARKATILGTLARTPRRSAPTVPEMQFTFLRVEPLTHLPTPQRSRELLNRLKDDRGIRATMGKHGFTVGLLTEMDPAQYTAANHEGTTRILGLNRNRGEVIELRLRTDAYDGYRDYKTIRKTLCHELAHNKHTAHDRDFWFLCARIEREVAAADHGRAISYEEYYAPPNPQPDEEDVPDPQGWIGGSYTLGGVGNNGDKGLSQREILARAAEDRQRQARDHGNGEGSSRSS